MKRNSIFSRQHKHIPMTKRDYFKRGSRWVLANEEHDTISDDQAGWILDSAGLPFERSHRRYKRDRYGHSHPYDTFESVSPDGTQKTVWAIDFAQGDKNYSKLVRRYYQRRIARKARKAQEVK